MVLSTELPLNSFEFGRTRRRKRVLDPRYIYHTHVWGAQMWYNTKHKRLTAVENEVVIYRINPPFLSLENKSSQ
jgi:hypothetical protein